MIPVSKMSSSNSVSLVALPTEMHLAIIEHLSLLDLHTLRLTNHYFYALIPPPTHADLLVIEQSRLIRQKRFFACVGCTKLRPKAAFSPEMYKKKKNRPGQPGARERFCIECGRRPLPGPHRYKLGLQWKEDGVCFVRCVECENIARGFQYLAAPVCLSCHRQRLEAYRNVDEMHRVQREAEAHWKLA